MWISIQINKKKTNSIEIEINLIFKYKISLNNSNISYLYDGKFIHWFQIGVEL